MQCSLLPCTTPTGRGEDGLFGVVTSYLYPDALTLHLPLTIGHAPHTSRRGFHDSPEAVTPDCGQFLRHWVRFHASRSQSPEPGGRLCDLASQLIALGNTSVNDLVALLDEYLRFTRTEHLEALHQHWSSASDAPDFWKADVLRMIEADSRALEEAAPPRLSDWPRHVNHEECGQRLRRACLELGEAFEHWPAVWQAARDARERQAIS